MLVARAGGFARPKRLRASAGAKLPPFRASRRRSPGRRRGRRPRCRSSTKWMRSSSQMLSSSRRWTSSSPRSAASPPEASTRSGGAASGSTSTTTRARSSRSCASAAACDLRAVTAANVNRALVDAVGRRARRSSRSSRRRCRRRPRRCNAGSHRNFTPAELDLVQGLASEAALVLGRTRSNEALRAALERERLVAEIGRRVRSELDLETVLRVAVEETAKAIGVTRSFVRLGELGEPMPFSPNGRAGRRVRRRYGRAPAGPQPGRPRATDRGRRRHRDVRGSRIRLGDLQALLDLDVKATLATPIVVFDRMIGVFNLHRTEKTRWLPGEIALAEAVARELGLAIPHGPAARRERAAPAPPGDADPGRAGRH